MRKRRNTPTSAMTDIAFLLLLFFLILAITSVQTPVPINPAQESAKEIDLTGVPTLFIAGDGRVYQQNGVVDPDTLASRESYALLSDRATEFKDIHPVIEVLKQKGVQTIHLLVEEAR